MSNDIQPGSPAWLRERAEGAELYGVFHGLQEPAKRYADGLRLAADQLEKACQSHAGAERWTFCEGNTIQRSGCKLLLTVNPALPADEALAVGLLATRAPQLRDAVHALLPAAKAHLRKLHAINDREALQLSNTVNDAEHVLDLVTPTE